MPSGPLVSVMLPARDAARTLRQAAHSCLHQSLEDLELLLVTNDSEPRTLRIMEELCREDSRVRLVESPPGAGFIAALNLAWREAQGSFLARMDADDWSYPERLQEQVALLQEQPDLAAVGSQVRILRGLNTDRSAAPCLPGYAAYESWLNALITPEAIATQRFIDSPIANPSAMIRREVFSRIGGYREVPWAEDYDFWLRLLESGMEIAKVDGVLLDWFDSDTRLTRNDPHYGQDRFLEAKAHYLARIEVAQKRGVVICGAGPIGKSLNKLLQQEGIRIHALLEVHPRRIGETIGGTPVESYDCLPLADQPILLGAVGRPGAREHLRKLALENDYEEGRDFFCLA